MELRPVKPKNIRKEKRDCKLRSYGICFRCLTDICVLKCFNASYSVTLYLLVYVRIWEQIKSRL
jgi:hypothetical protein